MEHSLTASPDVIPSWLESFTITIEDNSGNLCFSTIHTDDGLWRPEEIENLNGLGITTGSFLKVRGNELKVSAVHLLTNFLRHNREEIGLQIQIILDFSQHQKPI